MSNDTEALADIIARLEKATGADQEIDQLIAVFVSIIKNPERKVVAVANCASYTSSLDAIVGLIGRALPGFYWYVANGRGYVRPDELLGKAAIWTGHDLIAEAEAVTPELAFCLAFARALLAKVQ